MRAERVWGGMWVQGSGGYPRLGAIGESGYPIQVRFLDLHRFFPMFHSHSAYLSPATSINCFKLSVNQPVIMRQSLLSPVTVLRAIEYM